MFGSAAAKPGGFSFGAGGAAAPAANTGGGFSFGGGGAGATTAPNSTGAGFGFGAGSTTAAPAATGSSGFSFGGATNTTAAAPATGGGFGFGGAATPASGAAATTTPSFGFGTGAAQPSTTPSFGFGGSAAAAKPSLFGGTGSTTTTGGFGSSFGTGAAAKPAGTGFGFGSGATTGTGATGFGFGSGATATTPGFGTGATAFGTAPAAVTTPAPIIMGGDASVGQLNSVKYAYQDPMQSRFKFLMYNTVDPSQRHLYVRPAHISERLWEQAEQDNPDPLNCVPVPITGFKDLLKRIQVQQDYAEKYNTFTDDLRKQLKDMEKTSRTTEEKLDKCRHEHVQLVHMLVKVMKDIEFLQNLGKPLQRDEVSLAMALKKLQTLLNAPGQYKARLNDVMAMQRIQDTPQPPPANQLSPADLQRVYEFLDKQRQGLEHLTSILTEDLEDIKLMKETWRR